MLLTFHAEDSNEMIITNTDYIRAANSPRFQPSSRMEQCMKSMQAEGVVPVVLQRYAPIHGSFSTDGPSLLPNNNRLNALRLKELLDTEQSVPAPQFPGFPSNMAVVLKPGLLFESKRMPCDWDDCAAFVARANSDLVSEGNERIYLVELPMYDPEPYELVTSPKFVVSSITCPEEFILFAESRTNNLGLTPWEVAVFVQRLLERYPVEFVGATFYGVFLCVADGKTLDVASFNQDLSLLKEHVKLKAQSRNMQPIYLRWHL